MGLIELLLIVFLIVVFVGGGYGYHRRDVYGSGGPIGIAGILVIILIIALVWRLR